MRAPIISVALLASVILAACSTVAPPASPTPSAPPPSEGPGEPAFTVTVPGEAGTDMEVDVFDDEGTLETVRALTRLELAAALPRMTDEHVVALQAEGDDRSVILVWIGLQCDAYGRITVLPGAEQVDVGPAQVDECDLLPNGRGVLLTFKSATAAADIDVNLVRPL